MKQDEPTWQRARKPEQKEERRAAILTAAAKLLDRQGLDGTGLNAIAREVGLSKPNIYRYFESREAILLDLLLEEYRLWTDCLRQGLAELRKENDIEGFSLAFSKSVQDRKRFFELIGALATVLEHNVSEETIVRFKRQLNEKNTPLLESFLAAFPCLTPEQAHAAMAILVMSATGIWPHCHPAPAVQEVLKRPEFEPFRFEFPTMVQEHASLVLRGLLS